MSNSTMPAPAAMPDRAVFAEAPTQLLRVLSPVRVAVIVPARNEGAALDATLDSLDGQTLRPVRIIVVVNNSTDDTAEMARKFADRPGVPPTEVLEMPGVNEHKKAGALNYGICHLLTRQRVKYHHLVGDGWRLPAEEFRYLFTMDGDTILDPAFLERATTVAGNDRRLAGVSAACLGKPIRAATPWQWLLLTLQRVEYARVCETRIRRNIHTMSGAGSLYRTGALNQLLGTRPDIFDQTTPSLVEDYETTLALKQLGWRVTSNQHCVAWTDLMPTMRMLNAQRFRWVRGTIAEWRRYGWCRATWLSIVQVLWGLGGIGYAALWTAISLTVITAHHGGLDPRYLLVLAGFWSAYQGIIVRRLGWRVVLFEMSLIPEIAFNLLRNYWLIKSVAAAYLTRAGKSRWHQ
jgi:cellulose synthase/poly-beta-1,6-N-acetylglucosamine synthase-like glycosyltransferase